MIDRIYPQPAGVVLSTISDIVELQKAKLTFSDTPNGKVNFFINMYAYEWEFHFTVTDLGNKQSRVSLGIAGEQLGKDDMLRHELSLLDSMLNMEHEYTQKCNSCSALRNH
jgi:hypothetical protein